MLEAKVGETHSDGSTSLSAQQRPPELRFPDTEIPVYGSNSNHGSAGPMVSTAADRIEDGVEHTTPAYMEISGD